jgi:hypothetical protein
VSVPTLFLPHSDVWQLQPYIQHLQVRDSFHHIFLLSHSPHSFLPQHHQKAGTTTLFFSERRTPPTPQSLNPMTSAGHCQLPKTGVPTLVPCPPFLNSTASYPPCDYKSGPNPAPPPLQDMPSPIQKTGMTTLKTRIRLLANLTLDRTSDRPSSQTFPNRRTGTTTWMQTSLCPREKNTPGIRLMTTTASTRRTRPSPPVLAEALSANTLLPLPCPLSRFRWNPWERHFLAPPPCPFSPFLPPDTSLSTRIPHLHISLCAAGTRPPALCYTRARLPRKGAGAYERSRVHLTTTSLSCLTGDGISLPYPRLLNRPHQTRHLSIFLPPKPPTLPDLPSCHVSGLSSGGASVRDLPALAPPMLLRVNRPKGTRRPAPPPLGLDHHPALQVGFFGLRRARLIRLQAAHH